MEDEKTLFLTELKELLAKYGVFLIAHKTDIPVSVYFEGSADYCPFASIGKERNKGCGVVIDAKSFDYDKD